MYDAAVDFPDLCPAPPMSDPVCPSCGCNEALPVGRPNVKRAIRHLGGQSQEVESTTLTYTCGHCGRLWTHSTPWHEPMPLDDPAGPGSATTTAVQDPEVPAGCVIYHPLRCPACRSTKHSTSRPRDGNRSGRLRYHKCKDCGHKFRSFEAEE